LFAKGGTTGAVISPADANAYGRHTDQLHTSSGVHLLVYVQPLSALRVYDWLTNQNTD